MDGLCDITQEAVIKIISKKRKCKKAKWLSEEASQISDKKRSKMQRRFKKIRNIKGTFYAKILTIKDKNTMDLTEAEDIKKRW